jgi:hypothetical protein
LPGFAQAVRFVSSSRRDVRLVVGDASESPVSEADCVRIHTERGRVRIGSSVADAGVVVQTAGAAKKCGSVAGTMREKA